MCRSHNIFAYYCVFRLNSLESVTQCGETKRALDHRLQQTHSTSLPSRTTRNLVAVIVAVLHIMNIESFYTYRVEREQNGLRECASKTESARDKQTERDGAMSGGKIKNKLFLCVSIVT